jgi:hypothetical protein
VNEKERCYKKGWQSRVGNKTGDNFPDCGVMPW